MPICAGQAFASPRSGAIRGPDEAECNPRHRCRRAKHRRGLSSGLLKNIPLYRNSDLSYVSAIPAHQEGRSYVVTDREPGLRWARQRTLAAATKARWVCEQGHQQLEEELGLDHPRGATLARPSSSRTDDHDRLRLPSTPAPRPGQWPGRCGFPPAWHDRLGSVSPRFGRASDAGITPSAETS